MVWSRSERSAGCPRWGSRMGYAFGIAVSCALLLLAVTPAAAQDSGWVIKSFDVQLAVQANSDVRVTEDIAVDFGSISKHGIYRDIPVRNGYDGTRDRLIHIEDARVEGDPGTPVDLAVMDLGHTVRLRIGSPSRTISGPHRYRLSYRVVGVMNSFETHEELYWNVTGSQWSVPIERVSAHITGPAEVTRIACYRGPNGSTERCPEADIQNREGQTRTGRLEPGEGMTVVVAFPKGSVQVAPPELVSVPLQPDHLRGDMGAHLPTVMDFIIALLLCVPIGFGLVRLYQRQVRDESAMGLVRHGFGDRPPNGLRPALLNLLIHKRVGERDISATLVDLAVRGYLAIEQLPRSWWSSGSDWRLTRRRQRREDPNEPPLAEYELVLLNLLFASNDSVSMSELKGRFAGDYKMVRDLIYDAPEARDWFSGRADRARREWAIRAFVLAVGSLFLTFWACAIQRYDIAVWLVPFILSGFALGCLVSRMPRRTAAGSAMLQRTLDFREFIRTAEKRRAELSSQPDLFTELLPYAIALGVEDRWARVFSGLSSQALTRTPYGIWFFGIPGAAFISASALSSAVSDFGSHVGGTLASTPASMGSSGFGGGGGFSGGGGGGGGGGGW